MFYLETSGIRRSPFYDRGPSAMYRLPFECRFEMLQTRPVLYLIQTVPYIHDRMPQYNKHTSGDTNAGFTRQIRRLVPRFSNEKKYKGIGRFGALVCGIVLLCCFSCLCSFRIGAEYSSRALSRQYTTLAARRGVGGVGGRVLCSQNSSRMDIGIRN